jgi:hypothetical protein
MPADTNLVSLFTAAPPVTDFPRTLTIRVIGRDIRRDKPVREVTIHRYDLQRQLERWDACGVAHTGWGNGLVDWVTMGDWVLVEKSAKIRECGVDS